jgi:carboxyl-terminal processing protease
MAASLDDAHANFVTPEEFEQLLRAQRGEVTLVGIGVRLRGAPPTVAEVFRDSPAQGAGLQVGDTLVSIAGRDVTNLRRPEVNALLEGPAGTPIQLGVQRATTGQVDHLTVTRALFPIPLVEWQRLGGNVGYIRLRSFFDPSVVDQVEQAMRQLQDDGARGMIFDLRGNPGGLVDAGARLLSRFVPEGPIYRGRGRLGVGQTVSVRADVPLLTVPLVVLIDEGSGSTAEIFAAAVQEHRVAHVIGTTSAGAVAASRVYPLADGSALQLSVELVYSGAGALLDRVGVRPDEEVELGIADLRRGRDAQLERALGYLHEQAGR